MKKIGLLVLLSLSISTVNAKEYGTWDGNLILKKTETSTGMQHGIDAEYMERMLIDLAAHARNYPPSFDSESDKRRATRDAGMLAGVLNIFIDSPNVHPEMLFRAAMANNIAHNLDVPKAAEKANDIYQRLLKIAPDNLNVNYNYGVFLASASKIKESIPYLEKALSLGAIDAEYSLGMVYVSLGDKSKALQYLENYKKSTSNNSEVSKLIEALKNEKTEIKRIEK